MGYLFILCTPNQAITGSISSFEDYSNPLTLQLFGGINSTLFLNSPYVYHTLASIRYSDVPRSQFCYQLHPNETTSCGGNDGGSYDSSWINYTVTLPFSAQGVSTVLRRQGLEETLYTNYFFNIPSSCDNVGGYIRFYTYRSGQAVYFDCYNGTGLQNMACCGCGGGGICTTDFQDFSFLAENTSMSWFNSSSNGQNVTINLFVGDTMYASSNSATNTTWQNHSVNYLSCGAQTNPAGAKWGMRFISNVSGYFNKVVTYDPENATNAFLYYSNNHSLISETSVVNNTGLFKDTKIYNNQAYDIVVNRSTILTDFNRCYNNSASIPSNFPKFTGMITWTNKIDYEGTWSYGNTSYQDIKAVELSYIAGENLTFYVSDEINNILDKNCSCSGCSINGLNCSIPFNFWTISPYFTTNVTLQDSYAYGIDNCSNSLGITNRSNSYLIRFYNVETNNQVTSDASALFSYYGGGYDLNVSDSYNVSMCTYPPWAALDVSGILYYGQSSYGSKLYHFIEETFDENLQYLNLYLFNGTSENRGRLIVEVYDDFNNLISGANVKLLQYFSATHSYQEIAQCYSDSNGQCIFDVEINTKFYIATATATIGTNVYTGQSGSTGQLISLDGQTIQIHLKTSEQFGVDDIYDLIITPYNTSLVVNTSYLNAVFNDAGNDVHTVCIAYYIRNGISEIEQTSNCIIGSSGIINILGGYVLDRDYTWIAKIYVLEDDGTKKTYNIYVYDKLAASLATEFGLWLKPIILMILLSLLALSLYLKNINVFAVGEIILSPSTMYIYPNLFGGLTMSFLILQGVFIMYFASRKEEMS